MSRLWLILLLGGSLSALTLDESVQEALRSHPIIKERLNNFRATQQDLKIATAEYQHMLCDVYYLSSNHNAKRLNVDVYRLRASNGIRCLFEIIIKKRICGEDKGSADDI